MNTCPSDGVNKPVTHLKNVDFPAPFGPIKHRNSRALSLKLTLSLAVTPPKRMVNPCVSKTVSDVVGQFYLKTQSRIFVNHREWSKSGMIMPWIFEFVRRLGFTAVTYSVFTIQHPKGEEYTPPISVTMQRVINLATQYFLGFLRIWTVASVEELTC